MRRGIHPALTVIILVAVTIAIAVAAVSWMLGVFNSEQTQVSEGITFYSDSYFNSTNNTVYLHIKVHLKPMVVITDYRVVGANVTKVWIDRVISGSAWMNGTSIYAKVGSELIIGISVDKSFSPGTLVKVALYTSTGYVYWDQVEAR